MFKKLKLKLKVKILGFLIRASLNKNQPITHQILDWVHGNIDHNHNPTSDKLVDFYRYSAEIDSMMLDPVNIPKPNLYTPERVYLHQTYFNSLPEMGEKKSLIEIIKDWEVIPPPTIPKNKRVHRKNINTRRELIANTKHPFAEYSKDKLNRFNNLLKYKKHSSFFNQFKNISASSIKESLTKYQIYIENSTSYMFRFPLDITETVLDYYKKVYKITKDYPCCYIVRENSKSNEVVLLAQSPFGMYWQLLGRFTLEARFDEIKEPPKYISKGRQKPLPRFFELMKTKKFEKLRKFSIPPINEGATDNMFIYAEDRNTTLEDRAIMGARIR